MCSHYLVEPVACTPASGWEKGQVENQVDFARDNIFKPRLRFATLAELNAWLEDECRRQAAMRRHPDNRECSIAEMLETERASLVELQGSFAGFRESEAVASTTCLVTFDRNRYSVAASAAGRPVQVHAYAGRIVIRRDGQVLADHVRQSGRGHCTFDPWHYLPVLVRKPGALRNGAPFQDWSLPAPLDRLRRALGRGDNADRAFVSVLAAVPEHGIDAVLEACTATLAGGAVSAEVVLNIPARRRQPPRPVSVSPPPALVIKVPFPDCASYDRLRPSVIAAIMEADDAAA